MWRLGERGRARLLTGECWFCWLGDEERAKEKKEKQERPDASLLGARRDAFWRAWRLCSVLIAVRLQENVKGRRGRCDRGGRGGGAHCAGANPWSRPCARRGGLASRSLFFSQARALHAYVPTPSDEDQSLTFLAFNKGDIIDVIEMHESGWWEGCCKCVPFVWLVKAWC